MYTVLSPIISLLNRPFLAVPSGALFHVEHMPGADALREKDMDEGVTNALPSF